MSRIPLILAVVLTHLLRAAAPGVAQSPAPRDEWNSPATLELVRTAIARRATEVVDSSLQNYSADGRGYVYFILDAPELQRQSLVRTDQVALEVYWRSPNQGRQRIVGLREQQELPVSRLHYYLDRLTVVQDSYGQSIVIADGDNVKDVPHPVGSTGETFYDYRLVDSLTLRLPGVDGPVRVQELEVRPRQPDAPAVVGSIFLEAGSAALVRMSFTFTPSSYVDPRLDYINVDLENGLWQGRFWLPHEQRLEIRREIPELDLPFGTIIRTRMRIGDYRFNEDLPPSLFMSPSPITMAPRAQREAFPFERPIDEEWRLEGFGPPATLAEVRQVARTALRESGVSGLPRSRFSAGSASDLFRYNRAEGPALGLGMSFRPPQLTARVHGGWAFAARQPFGDVRLSTGQRPRVTLGGYLNRVREVGGSQVVSGAINTLGSLFLAHDYSDPYYATGAEIDARYPLLPEWTGRATVRFERQRSASTTSEFSILEVGDGFRPVHEIDRGEHASLSFGVRREAQAVAGGWWTDISGGITRLRGSERTFDLGRGELAIGATLTRSARRASLEAELRGGLTVGDLPRQELYLLGGRGTIPGFDFRSVAGSRMVIARGTASADLTHPWLRGRLSGGAGWTGFGSASYGSWPATRGDGFRGFLGIGLGIFYDLVQVDVTRGIGPAARTRIIIEAHPSFWGFL